MSQQTGAACYYWCGARFYFRLLSFPLPAGGYQDGMSCNYYTRTPHGGFEKKKKLFPD